MKKLFLLFFVLGVISLQSHSQPLLYSNELVLSLEADGDCVARPKNCNTDKTALTASLISGKLGELQVSAIAKLSGDKGKLGGQAWFKAGKTLWLGGQSVADLEWDFDHALYVAGEFSFASFHFYPFLILELSSESVGGAGLKVYLGEHTSVELEWKTAHDYTHNVVVLSLGFAINQNALERVFELLKIDKEEKVEDAS